ncbi:MAG: hypothetical protein QOF43_1396, partial [Gaiellaceae bacterium]|nr:hypothetical protein [Gaiellaceae bacterium]
LKAQVLRGSLSWGGTTFAVAQTKPTDATDPGDPAYDWAIYDRLVRYATQYNIKVLFSILFTPGWANGGKARNVAPTDFEALHDFAYAAAARYSGFYTPPTWQQDPSNPTSAQPLPKVGMWTAWNEPNNPIWLAPQYKRVGKTWRIESAFQYAKICNAVYSGIHDVLISPEKGVIAGEQVACGVTGPKGNDAPTSVRPSVDPLSFLGAAKKYGMKNFDVYAHHPYADAGSEAPKFVPKGKHARRVQIGNINVLLTQLTKLYGPKHLWITEYGYQTNPPDRTIFGTSWKNQATYMQQAYAIARSNKRIDMMLWFLVRDEPNIGGWQSGLQTVTGRQKPAWNVFKSIPRG